MVSKTEKRVLYFAWWNENVKWIYLKENHFRRWIYWYTLSDNESTNKYVR